MDARDNSTRFPRRSLVLTGAAAVAVLAAACSSAGGGTPAGGGSSSSSAAGHHTMSAASRATVRVETHSGPLGTYLTDGSGRTLYMFAADGPSKSNCTGSCVAYWPPFTAAGQPVAGGSAKATDLGTIARGGSRQVTYAGHPLYYYVGDHHAGDTSGQGSTGSGARWWIISPSGKPITTAKSAGSSASSSASTSSGGGSWG